MCWADVGHHSQSEKNGLAAHDMGDRTPLLLRRGAIGLLVAPGGYLCATAFSLLFSYFPAGLHPAPVGLAVVSFVGTLSIVSGLRESLKLNTAPLAVAVCMVLGGTAATPWTRSPWVLGIAAAIGGMIGTFWRSRHTGPTANEGRQ